MTMSHNEIGKALLHGMVVRLEQNGAINMEDVAIIFKEVAKVAQYGDSKVDDFIRTEITKLSEFISEAKGEIFAIVPDEDGEEDEFFNAAGQELNAVVVATEEATNAILDSSDEIVAVANSLSDGAAKAKINDEVVKIFDACSFQDITGQRITKVIKTLEYVEAKVAKLAKIFGHESQGVAELSRKDADAILKDARPDAELMEGPQLDNQGVSQDDIDKLFD